LKQQFVAGFSQLPDEEMGFVCSGSLIWKLVAAQWQQANQEQQARMNQQYSESLGQQGSSSEFSSARDYRKLSELMMRTHATSMNILEATSGSNNYWKVVDQYR
jgi:aromatic ring-opening dioxygenase catalytic subunit (LigB family)